MQVFNRYALFATSLLLASWNVNAHHNVHYPALHQGHFHHHFQIAQHYPHQLAAAAQWRANHIGINLHKNYGLIAHFNWHPSVVAVLHYPYLLNQYQFIPRRPMHQRKRNLRRNNIHRRSKRVIIRRH